MAYAELHCLSHFTFLRGASSPEELVGRAHELGYAALAITDECSVAGAVRAHVAARDLGFPLILGSEFTLADGLRLVVLATSRAGYGALCRLITRGRRAASKGSYHLTRADLETGLDDCLLLWLPGRGPDEDEGTWLRERFAGRLWLAVELSAGGEDRSRLACLTGLSGRLGLPAVASGDVHMHLRGRRALQDTLTAIRHGIPLKDAGFALAPNGERHLRATATLRRLYPRELLDETLAIAARCRFSLDELRYEYPEEIVPAGTTPAGYLRRLTEEGIRRRWPEGEPRTVRDMVSPGKSQGLSPSRICSIVSSSYSSGCFLNTSVILIAIGLSTKATRCGIRSSSNRRLRW
jgi:error-prone DNA polymerase